MPIIVAVRHTVSDFDQWKPVFDEHQKVREFHGALGHMLLTTPGDPNTQLVINEFPSAEAAEAFASDPSLPEAMSRGGVVDAPRIEVYELAERVTY